MDPHAYSQHLSDTHNNFGIKHMSWTNLYKETKNGWLLWSIISKESGIQILHGLEGTKLIEENITLPNHQHSEEITRRINKKLNREGYSLGKTTPTYLRPMLANKYIEHGHKLPTNIMVQPKLDGIRCIADKGTMVTRRGVAITSCPHILDSLQLLPPEIILDGELYIHDMPIQDISGLVRSQKVLPNCLKITYRVFDLIDTELPFTERFLKAQSIIKPIAYIHMVETRVTERASIQDQLKNYVAQGYEGLIIRDPKSLYQCDVRSDSLQKYKLTEDGIFEIVDTEAAETGREKDAILFVCQTADGQTFKSRPAFSINKRVAMWGARRSYHGQWAKVEFHGYHKTGIPKGPAVTVQIAENKKDIL